MSLSDFLDIKYFLASFFVGMFLVYIFSPVPEIILRYPTPENMGKLVYKDHAGVCYVYDGKKVNCPMMGTVQTPIQHANINNIDSITPWQKVKNIVST